MKVTINDIKDVVLDMPGKEKNKLLLQLLKKNPEVMNKIYYKHVAGEKEANELVDELKEETDSIIAEAGYKRGNLHKNLARGIEQVSKAINQYKSVLSPEKEAEILDHLLDIIFSHFSNELGTCWTAFDFKVARTLSRLITLVSRKMHEDYRVEFEDRVNSYLQRLKRISSHLDYIYDLPNKLMY